MQLLTKNLVTENQETFNIPPDLWLLPEKVIQFGTGVLLRGLVDFVIDRANRQQLFNGRVVVVKSTDNAVVEFEQQDNLYTVMEEGLNSGVLVKDKQLVTAISRVLSAQDQWNTILACATAPLIEIVVSNTTEAGLVYVAEKFNDQAPQSFPAKLTAYLWHRYQFFKGDPTKGMVILPTELKSENGSLLQDYVLRHAAYNQLPSEFVDWLRQYNYFCNTLVDRIVPGKSAPEDVIVWDEKVSYIDHLHTKAEPFLLWAIAASDVVKSKLNFAQVDDRIIISESIAGFEEQKIRILNGSNSFVVSLAFLAGCNTLADTVTDELFADYTAQLIHQEIIPTIIDQCPHAPTFAQSVLDRFANPFVQYKLLNIALQSTSKMNSRNAITIARYHQNFGHYPPLALISLAAYFLFYLPAGKDNGAYYGLRDGVRYAYRDEHADFVCAALATVDWADSTSSLAAIKKIFSNAKLFATELAALPNLAETVLQYVTDLRSNGIRTTIQANLKTKQ